ncbi:hypothetical protein CLCAR_1867 [Clostridium carboxidivorans P7]|nr:hypothetical protein CLCAR_1867 [Clostridium carboxidivorans P7]
MQRKNSNIYNKKALYYSIEFYSAFIVIVKKYNVIKLGI